MKGFKGYNQDLICKGKRFKENTIIQIKDENNSQWREFIQNEKEAMHFYENPLNILSDFPLLDEECKLNAFSEVEVLKEDFVEENMFCKSYVKKLKVGKNWTLKNLLKSALII